MNVVSPLHFTQTKTRVTDYLSEYQNHPLRVLSSHCCIQGRPNSLCIPNYYLWICPQLLHGDISPQSTKATCLCYWFNPGGKIHHHITVFPDMWHWHLAWQLDFFRKTTHVFSSCLGTCIWMNYKETNKYALKAYKFCSEKQFWTNYQVSSITGAWDNKVYHSNWITKAYIGQRKKQGTFTLCFVKKTKLKWNPRKKWQAWSGECAKTKSFMYMYFWAHVQKLQWGVNKRDDNMVGTVPCDHTQGKREVSTEHEHAHSSWGC